MTEVLGVVIITFWTAAGSSCLEIRAFYGFFDYFLVQRGKVFFDFTVKRIIGKVPKILLLVEVGAPNDYRDAFVGCFDSNVFAFTKVQKDR